MQCKNLEKHQKIKSNSSWWQERLKIRAGNNKMETNKLMKRISKSKCGSLRIQTIYRSLAELTKKKEMAKFTNQIGNIITDTKEIQNIIKG